MAGGFLNGLAHASARIQPSYLLALPRCPRFWSSPQTKQDFVDAHTLFAEALHSFSVPAVIPSVRLSSSPRSLSQNNQTPRKHSPIMQLITALSAAAGLVATVSARSAIALNESCDKSKPLARIVNRCPYDVYLWSVFKGDGCPSDQMVTLKTGESYSENFQAPENGVGVSIKLSKTQQCKHQNLVQLEYYLETGNPMYAYNYWDVSYVDCLDEDCPTKHEGYYAVAGTQVGKFAASAENTWCPILACHDAVSCAKMSYILPDDVQTKTCSLDQNIDFYMCGGEAPTGDYDNDTIPIVPVPKPAPSHVEEYPADAVVTPGPKPEELENAKVTTKVEIVYVTETEYTYAKRHAHAHARRHQQFHA